MATAVTTAPASDTSRAVKYRRKSASSPSIAHGDAGRRFAASCTAVPLVTPEEEPYPPGRQERSGMGRAPGAIGPAAPVRRARSAALVDGPSGRAPRCGRLLG